MPNSLLSFVFISNSLREYIFRNDPVSLNLISTWKCVNEWRECSVACGGGGGTHIVFFFCIFNVRYSFSIQNYTHVIYPSIAIPDVDTHSFFLR